MLSPRAAAGEEGGMADRRAFARVLRELQEGEPAPWDPTEPLSRVAEAAAAVLGADGAVLVLRDDPGPRHWLAGRPTRPGGAPPGGGGGGRPRGGGGAGGARPAGPACRR